MSNEELAARIKDGKREYIEILWNQNQGIIRKIAGRYLWRAQIMRYDFEDLTQECYFALVSAVEAYKPEGGYMFITYLVYHIRNTLGNMLMLRGNDRYIVPLSLDAPIADEEGEADALGSFVPSPENLEEDATERIAMKELRTIVNEECDAETACIVWELFGDDRPGMKELAQKYGTTPSRLKKRIDAALVRIQGKARLKGIIQPRRIYRYSGGTSWNSTTESSALDNIQAEERELRRVLWGERSSHP